MTLRREGLQIDFGPRMDTAYSWSPNWSIDSALDCIVRVDEPESMASLRDRYLNPLWALMVFASNRPNAGLVRGLRRSDGAAYSSARLLAAVTALESFADTRLTPRPRTLLKRLRALQAYGEVPAAVTGCSERALELTSSRNYHAHLSEPRFGRSHEQISEGLVDSVRRAEALYQACVLRELGFAPERRIEVLERLRESWPLPTL